MKCSSCGYENSQDARYCGLCQKPFVSFAREPSAPYGLAPLAEPSKEAVKTVKKILRSQSTGDNWFQRHLNWTWLLAGWAVGLIAYFLATIFVTSLFASSTFPSEASFFASFSVIQIVVLVLQIAAVYGVGAWVLKRKKRSLPWLFILFFPMLGWVIFLCLENRSELLVPSGPSSSSKSSGSIQPGLASPDLGAQYGKYGP